MTNQEQQSSSETVVRVKRSNGRIEYVKAKDFGDLNRQRKLRDERIRNLVMQRNGAIVIAVLACLLAFFATSRAIENLAVASRQKTERIVSNAEAQNLQSPGQGLVQTAMQDRTNDQSDMTSEKSVAEVEISAVQEPPAQIIDATASFSELPREPNLAGLIDTNPVTGVVDSQVTQNSLPESTQIAALADDIAAQSQLADRTQQKIQAMLRAWAKSWSDQNVDDYFRFYSNGFAPNGGQSLAEWKDLRRERIRAPEWLQVRLEDMDVAVFGKRANVLLTQHYAANHYSGVSEKFFELIIEDDSWRILKELSRDRDQ